MIQNETLNWRGENINLGANASILSPITSKVIQLGPMNQKKMISSSVISTVIQEGLFFNNILKVAVLFERKNWLGFYL